MMAAITASKQGHKVTLIEKMPSLGRKLLITGKGRCNITSSLDMSKFIENTPTNGKFLYSCFQNFTNQDIIKFLKEEGLEVKEERGNRIFPVTDKSLDVLKCFTKKLKKQNIKIEYNTRVTELIVSEIEDDKSNLKNEYKSEAGENKKIGIAKVKKEKKLKIEGVKTLNGDLEKIEKVDKVILATGGKSYPLTGSTGDGYILAKKVGHTITELRPSLIPLETYDLETCKKLQGLTLKNIAITITDIEKNKKIYEDFGEMIFTHFGVSGPIILSASAHLTRYKSNLEKMKNKKIILKIDLKPALSEEKLEERILRDFNELKNKQFKNSLNKLLPQKIIPVIIKKSKIQENKKVNEITREERKQLVHLLKDFEIEVKGFRPIEEAIITSGGVSTREINPKTMESKIVKGLYFAGEIIDVDSYTGGFNLQIAYSTGYTAGSN